MNLREVSLSGLSDVRYSFWEGEHQGKNYDRTVLVIRFEGTYRIGSGGNPDATFMVSLGKAGVEAFTPAALIIDLSELSYEWGDQMEWILELGDERRLPNAIVVGSRCRNAIGTLCFGEGSTTDPCEKEEIFDSLEGAWQYVTKLLDDGETPPIHEAAKAGDYAQVKELIDSGENPNRLDSTGRTPLHVALNADVVKVLIASGANVKATDAHGSTPLHFATNLECAVRLLAAGADPDARNSNRFSPLSQTTSVEIAKLLIEAGADIHLRHRDSLLHTVRGSDLAKLFIDYGIGVNTLDPSGRTPLDVAESREQLFQWQAGQQAQQYAKIAKILRASGGKRSTELKA